MGVPSTHTVSVGDKVTAADENTYVRDANTFFLSQPRVAVTHSTTQSIPTGTFTAHLFDTETFDTDTTGDHSTSSATSKFTILTPGTYLLSAAVAFAGNATGRRGGAFYKNGAILTGSEILVPASVATSLVIPMAPFMVQTVATDYLEFYVYQDSGSALNANPGSGASSSFQALWVGTP